MYCTYCGNTIDESKNYVCTHCHRPLSAGQYAPPEGFALDLKSGWYYKGTREIDAATGQGVFKVLWFHPISGEYKPVTYPDAQRQCASPTGYRLDSQSGQYIQNSNMKDTEAGGNKEVVLSRKKHMNWQLFFLW